MAGQTINDRLLAARHSIAGQGLAKSVCKATTEEMIAPKKKHLDCEYYEFLRYKTVVIFLVHNRVTMVVRSILDNSGASHRCAICDAHSSLHFSCSLEKL